MNASAGFFITIVGVFILFNAHFTNGQECPPSCGEDSCKSSLTPDTCPPGTHFDPNGSICGCCPGCRGGLGFGISGCSEFSENHKCAPGLKCNSQAICELDKSNCLYVNHLRGTSVQMLPTCDPDGTFAPVQCKGDKVIGRCFCYAKSGKRIHGWAWWKDSHDMTCACSRLRAELEQEDSYEDVLHCDAKGNFEPLQCSSGVCWCAEPTSGEIVKGTTAVPQAMWTFLPCYDSAKFGVKYLRQCESAAHAQIIMQNAMFTHGTTNAEFSKIRCDYDGASGFLQVEQGIASCRWRDGSKIGSYQDQATLSSKMDCSCARDQKFFAEAGLNHVLDCSGNGNYAQIQEINGKFFCVDKDGFAVSKTFPSAEGLDCAKYLYYEFKDIPDDFDPDSKDDDDNTPPEYLDDNDYYG